MKSTNRVNSPQHSPDAKWHQWTLDNLAPSKDFWVSDIDGFIRSRNGCFILIELKRRGQEMSQWQRNSYGIIAQLLKNAEGQTLPPNSEYGLKYAMKIKHFCGVQEISFEETWFDDGKVYLNGKPSTEEEIRHHLSFGAFCQECFPASCRTCCDAVIEELL